MQYFLIYQAIQEAFQSISISITQSIQSYEKLDAFTFHAKRERTTEYTMVLHNIQSDGRNF